MLCAAPPLSIPNDDLSIEAAELKHADAELSPRICTSEAEVEQAAAGADGLVTIGLGLSRQTLVALSQCRAIVTVSHGFNHIDVAAATELGIPVANTYFCHEDVANHTLMLLLACARKLTILHQELAAGRWRRDLLGQIPPIYGQTLGLVGFGHIGAAVARRGQVLGLEVLAYDPFVESNAMALAGVRRVPLSELLQQSDFVSLHVPFSEQTRHLIGEPELSMMRPTAYLLNTARGALVDGQALVRALSSGWIAGAGLDVFEEEPPDPSNPLLTLPNVVHTPHSAGTSVASIPNGRRQAATALALALNGFWPPHVLNPEVRTRTRFPFVDSDQVYETHA
jgi:D-3-phosphoglycerate dehydrogenase / 2-oxoglutarate reductase